MITCSDFNIKSQDVRHWFIAFPWPSDGLSIRSLHWNLLPAGHNQPEGLRADVAALDVGPGAGGEPRDVAQHLQRVRLGDRGLRADRSHRGARADNLALDVNISRTSHQLQFRLQFEEAWTTSQRRWSRYRPRGFCGKVAGFLGRPWEGSEDIEIRVQSAADVSSHQAAAMKEIKWNCIVLLWFRLLYPILYNVTLALCCAMHQGRGM